METTAKKTIDDIRKQANIMLASGYSVTTTSHVLGINTDTLKKWIEPDHLALKSSGHKFTRKM